MAYIGRQLARGENRLFDDISGSFNGSTTTFNLTISSVATSTATPFQLFVSLGGVMQKPNTDFTTAGNQITFTTAPAAGLSCWMMMQGDTIDSAAIPDASVTPSKISGSGDFAFPADIRLKDADGSHYLGFQAPSTVSNNVVWTLPATDTSVSGYVLSSDGSGNLSWVEAGDSSSPSFTGDVTLTNDGSIVGFSSLHGTYTGSVKTYTVTVASKSAAHRYNGTGSGNGYKINGKEAPFLTLTPGRTYKFDQSDGSNSGHPFRFYLEANKTTAFTTGVTTNGTAGSSGAYTQIVVSDTTPQVLHYQCSAHGYMGNAVQANSNVAAAGSLNGATLASSVTGSSLTSVGTLGSLAVSGNATVGGNLTVSGTTTTVDSVTLSVKDKNIELGVVSSPSDTTADGGGITLKGASDHTFNWINSTDAWTSSEHIALGDSKKLLFGAASDLQILHDGNNNLILGSPTVLIKNQANSESYIRCTENAAVELYHNNAKKIETTSSGINVTGAIQVNGAALSAAPEITGTASGTITAEKPCIIKSDGTIDQVEATVTPQTPTPIVNVPGNSVRDGDPIHNGTGQTGTSIAYDEVGNTFLAGARINNYVYVKLGYYGTASSTDISWGTLHSLGGGYDSSICFDPTKECYVSFRNSSGGTTSINLWKYTSTSKVEVTNTKNVDLPSGYDGGYPSIMYHTGIQKPVIAFVESAKCYLSIIHINSDATDATVGTPFQVVASGSNYTPRMFEDTTRSGRIYVGARYDSDDDYYIHNLTIPSSGDSFTRNSVVRAVDGASSNDRITNFVGIRYDPEAGKALMVYREGSNATKTIVLTPSDSSCSVGSKVTLFSSSSIYRAEYMALVYEQNLKKLVWIWQKLADDEKAFAAVLTISGTSASLGTISAVLTSGSTSVGGTHGIGVSNAIFNTKLGQIIWVGVDAGNNTWPRVWNLQASTSVSNLTSENFVGFPNATYTNGQTATIKVVGNTSTQSSLTPGKKYYVKNNGTINISPDSPVVEAGLAISSTKLLIKPA